MDVNVSAILSTVQVTIETEGQKDRNNHLQRVFLMFVYLVCEKEKNKYQAFVARVVIEMICY